MLKKLVTFNDRNLLHISGLPSFTGWCSSSSSSSSSSTMTSSSRCRRTGVTVVSWSRPIAMSSVLRIKDVTRSTLNDLLLTGLAGALRHYLLSSGVANPGDMTATLLVDLQPPAPCPPPPVDTTPSSSVVNKAAWDGGDRRPSRRSASTTTNGSTIDNNMALDESRDRKYPPDYCCDGGAGSGGPLPTSEGGYNFVFFLSREMVLSFQGSSNSEKN